MFIPYVMATRKDPGILKPDPQLDFIDLLQKFDANELCADCKVIRTPRSRHCQVCNVCVERFDHHCPWINNCVGVNNHNNYLFFVTYAWIYALLVMCIAMDCKTSSIIYLSQALAEVHQRTLAKTHLVPCVSLESATRHLSSSVLDSSSSSYQHSFSSL